MYIKSHLKQFMSLFDSHPALIMLLDEDYNILKASRSFTGFSGYSASELEQHYLTDFCPDLRDPPQKPEFKCSFKKKNGLIVPVLIQASNYKTEKDKKNHYILIFTEISKQKSLKEKLKEQKHFLNPDLIDFLPISIFEADLSGKITYANRKALELFGYTKDDIKKEMTLFDCIAPEERERLKLDIKNKSNGIENNVSFEYNVLRNNGTIFPVVLKTGFIKENGEVKGIRGVLLDISGTDKTAKELRLSEERYKRLIENIPDFIYTLDADGRFTSLNQFALNILGYKEKEIIGRSFLKIMHPDDRELMNEVFMEAIAKKKQKPKGMTFRLLTKKGEAVWVSLNANIIFDKGGTFLQELGIARDITKRRYMENETLKKQKLESLGVLAGGIAHNFNNILTGILGNLSLAKTYLYKEDALYNVIDMAEKASLKAEHLTRQLLIFAKGDSPVKEKTSIKEIIKDTAQFVLSGSNVKCNFKFEKNLWAAIVDTEQLGQVIHNLIRNAVQAMPEGGTINVQAINKTIDEEGIPSIPLSDYVVITIKDEGIGISEENISKIFDPYFTTEEKRTGLGLAICYSIIKKHNGYIYVESEEGKGTAFHIYLPASRRGYKKEGKNDNEIIMGSGRILIMDDDEMVRETISLILGKLGYDVDIAQEGREAIDKYKKARDKGQNYKAVIMDLTIPGGMGGKEAIRLLREIDRNIPAIVSSGYSQDPVLKNYAAYGFSGVITKPYRISEISKVISEALK